MFEITKHTPLELHISLVLEIIHLEKVSAVIERVVGPSNLADEADLESVKAFLSNRIEALKRTEAALGSGQALWLGSAFTQ